MINNFSITDDIAGQDEKAKQLIALIKNMPISITDVRRNFPDLHLRQGKYHGSGKKIPGNYWFEINGEEFETRRKYFFTPDNNKGKVSERDDYFLGADSILYKNVFFGINQCQ